MVFITLKNFKIANQSFYHPKYNESGLFKKCLKSVSGTGLCQLTENPINVIILLQIGMRATFSSYIKKSDYNIFKI